MTPEPVEALVERVRRGWTLMNVLSAEAALIELAERVKAAERERDALGEGANTYAARAAAAKAQRDELVEALVERIERALQHPRVWSGRVYEDAVAAARELAERVKAAERERDACMEMAKAERPPDAVFDKAREITGYVPSVQESDSAYAVDGSYDPTEVRGEAEPPGWGADRRCPEC